MRRTFAALLAVVLVLLWAPAQATDLAAIPATVHSAYGPFALQTAATSGDGVNLPINHHFVAVAVYLEWTANCTAGVVVVQVARTTAGPWVTVATVNYHAAAAVDWVAISGPVGAVRASITTPVTGTGASVTVNAYGN